MIVLATATPDHTFPATATKVQAQLGMKRGVAFDIQAVCSGFIFALATVDNAIRLGQARTALVIGAETFSRILDWNDRGTCVLFGDGAGAIVMKAEQGGGSPTVLNAANETAVHAFIEGRIGFLDIAAVVEETLEALPGGQLGSLDDVYHIDAEARAQAAELAARRARNHPA